jgi:hypothetical protein
MTKPLPDQSVFEFQEDSQVNPFISSENFQECRHRMNKIKEDKGEFGYLQSHQVRGQSQRLFLNMSPTSKGRERLATPLVMNTGRSSPTSIKVL